MKKRITALILSALMLLSLAACATPGDTTAHTDPVDTTATPETTLPEETELTPNLPDVGDRYKGTEFVILHRGTEVTTYRERWIWADGITGETVNDAIYKRNSMVEEKYGVTIKQVVDSKPHDAISTAIASGDDLYDIAFPQMVNIRPYLLQGACYNLLDLSDYFNFDAPWWDTYAAEEFTYSDKLFVGINDISLTSSTLARGIFFNRDLAKEYNLEDPYELVANNQWTLEKLGEMVMAVSNDVNGNSMQDDEDVYGMLTDSGNIYSFVIGCGIPMFKTDWEGNITIEFMGEETISVYEICDTFLTNKVYTRDYTDLKKPGDFPDTIYNYARSLFCQDKFLFTQLGCSGFEELVRYGMESEYGIVPNPKMSPEQDRYYHNADTNTSVFCIPTSNNPDDLERIAIITEYMSYVSSKTVLPEYYETIIKLRRARVPELGEMVDLIKNSLYYDITTLYGLTHYQIVLDAFESGAYSSVFSRVKPSLETQITKFKEKLAVLD